MSNAHGFHEGFVADMYLLIDNKLDEVRAEEVRAQINSCEDCAAEWHEIKEMGGSFIAAIGEAVRHYTFDELWPIAKYPDLGSIPDDERSRCAGLIEHLDSCERCKGALNDIRLFELGMGLQLSADDPLVQRTMNAVKSQSNVVLVDASLDEALATPQPASGPRLSFVTVVKRYAMAAALIVAVVAACKLGADLAREHSYAAVAEYRASVAEQKARTASVQISNAEARLLTVTNEALTDERLAAAAQSQWKAAENADQLLEARLRNQTLSRSSANQIADQLRIGMLLKDTAQSETAGTTTKATPLTPVNTLVPDLTPEIRWNSPPGFIVMVTTAKGVSVDGTPHGNTWTPRAPLQPGTVYVWYVTRPGRLYEQVSTPVRFATLPTSQHNAWLREIAGAPQSDRIARALIDLKYGLFQTAADEVASVRSGEANKIRASIQQLQNLIAAQ